MKLGPDLSLVTEQNGETVRLGQYPDLKAANDPACAGLTREDFERAAVTYPELKPAITTILDRDFPPAT